MEHLAVCLARTQRMDLVVAYPIELKEDVGLLGEGGVFAVAIGSSVQCAEPHRFHASTSQPLVSLGSRAATSLELANSVFRRACLMLDPETDVRFGDLEANLVRNDEEQADLTAKLLLMGLTSRSLIEGISRETSKRLAWLSEAASAVLSELEASNFKATERAITDSAN